MTALPSGKEAAATDLVLGNRWRVYNTV